jgi:hypothetical protein
LPGPTILNTNRAALPIKKTDRLNPDSVRLTLSRAMSTSA